MPEKSIDWQAIHERLVNAESAISGCLDLDTKTVNRILEQRARALAKTHEKEDEEEYREVLAFSFAGESYAIETCYVREVCKLKDLAALPGTPSFLAGIMNLRGNILAIIDLRRFFDLPPRGLTELNRVIVIEGEGGEFGLLADTIDGVRQLKNSGLQESLPMLNGIREQFLIGVTGQMLALLNGERLLSDENLKVNMGRAK